MTPQSWLFPLFVASGLSVAQAHPVAHRKPRPTLKSHAPTVIITHAELDASARKQADIEAKAAGRAVQTVPQMPDPPAPFRR